MIDNIKNNEKYLETVVNKFPEVLNSEKVKQELNDNPFTNYVVYILNNEVVAFINYYIMYDRAEVININVEKKTQSQGIGYELMNYMINDCFNKKVRSITLEVRIDNINAINLYKKCGFNTVNTRKGYYNGIDGLLMEKELI